MDTGQPIVALATPPGRSALAVLRTSGQGAIELCSSCFNPAGALASAEGHSLVHGWFIDPASGERIDEVLAAIFRNPRSFTGEDSVEFYCHGSSAVIARLIEALKTAGFAQALPGEFSFRAFLHGKTDLVRAEAINELSGAACEAAREDALRRLGGALSMEIRELRNELLDLLAEIEARLDYPADEVEGESLGVDLGFLPRLNACRARLEKLSSSYIAGKLRQDGALVVVAGRPNSGKSSLFNLILREERAIVSPEPGTTRDYLEVWVEMGGYALRLVDTAGLRHALGDIEAEGVRRSLELSTRADLLLYMADGRKELSDEDYMHLERYPAALKLWNKVDLPDCLPPPSGWLGLSAKKGDGLPALESAIIQALDAQAGSTSGTAKESLRLASERQKEHIDKCLDAIISTCANLADAAPLDALALDIREAADHLGQISGEISSEEVFDRIFGAFCLGK